MGRSKLPGFVHPLFGAVRLGCKSDNLVQQTNAKEEKWSYPPQGVSPIRVEDQNSQFRICCLVMLKGCTNECDGQ